MQRQPIPKRVPYRLLVSLIAVASLILISILCSSYLQQQSQDHNCSCPRLEIPEIPSGATAATAAAVGATSAFPSKDLANTRSNLETYNDSAKAAAISAAIPITDVLSELPPSTSPSVAASSNGNDCGNDGYPFSSTLSSNKTDDNRPFIYVYDTLEAWTEGIARLPKEWYSDQYDVEVHLTELIMRSNAIRTTDPERASLFYVPYYSSHHIAHVNKVMKNIMHKAAAEASKAWIDILTTIRRDFPYFNRTNGRDHFSAITYDHGRCHALTWVNPDLYGEMFFVMLNGDRQVRSMHASVKRNFQIIGYNYRTPVLTTYPDIPCYMPDRDIVVPAFINNQVPIESPFNGDRPMRAIFRFFAQQGHQTPLMHHGHDLRKELLEMYKDRRIKGWSFASQGERATNKEWQKSVFCICPPGHSQWTSRPFKALISGCIPVTFFREHDNPWQDELDYTSFAINIDPDNITSLPHRLETAPVEELQRNVDKVQGMFKWTRTHEWGAEKMLIKRLRQRGAQLSSTSLFR